MLRVVGCRAQGMSVGKPDVDGRPASDKPQGRKARKKDPGLWVFERGVVLFFAMRAGVRELSAVRTSQAYAVLVRKKRLMKRDESLEVVSM